MIEKERLTLPQMFVNIISDFVASVILLAIGVGIVAAVGAVWSTGSPWLILVTGALLALGLAEVMMLTFVRD